MRDVRQWMKSVEDRLSNLDRRLKSGGPRFPDTGWLDLPLINGWTNYGGVYQIAQYGRFGGEVRFRGLIVGTSRTATAFFIAPAGFRHSGGDQVWGAPSNSAGLMSRIDTKGTSSSGTVGTMSWVTGETTFISLSGISYPAEA